MTYFLYVKGLGACACFVSLIVLYYTSNQIKDHIRINRCLEKLHNNSKQTDGIREAALYVRKSTSTEDKQQNSLRVQLTRCTTTVAGTLKLNMSSKTKRRAGRSTVKVSKSTYLVV